MRSLLARASWRNLFRHPWLLALLILGVALGVAVVVAVDLTNESSSRAFELSVENIAGETTHQIIGGPNGFDESIYTELRRDFKLRSSAPVVEGYVEAEGETLNLLGLDPFAEMGFRQNLAGTTRENTLRLLAEPNTILMSQVTAERLNISPEDELILEYPGQLVPAKVIGLLEAEGREGVALDGVIIADISTAQDILNKTGRLDHIDLILENPDAVLPALESWLPAGLEVINAESRNDATSQMTRAFEINLTAMSFLALVVGMFLIYNTMTFSVLQRRNLIGTLRVLGATRRQVFSQILLEAFVIGLIGTVLGLVFGYLLAQGLINLVTKTINDFYFVLQVKDLLVSPMPFIKGLLLGIGAALVSAIPPALEAALSPPRTAQRRSVIERRAHVLVPWLFVFGAAVGFAAWGILAIPSKSVIIGFIALFLLILGFSLATPVPILLFSWLGSRITGLFGSILGRMSARGVTTALSRTGIAIAALAVAVSATIGTGVMIGSFRVTVNEWISQTLQSDVYVTAPHPIASRVDGTLPPDVPGILQEIPNVDRITLRRVVEVESGDGPARVLAIQPPEETFRDYSLKKGDPDSLWPDFTSGEIILVSEPYAYQHDVSVDDEIELLTRNGYRDFTIGGIFYDYSTDRGMVMIHLDPYQSHWGDFGISSVGLDASARGSPDELIGEVRAAMDQIPNVIVRPAGEIRELSMEVFDRTFTITNVLRMLAVIVAFVGVLSAMMALQLERTRELAVLRATGVTPGQLWASVAGQTGLMGLIAGILSVPLGLVMSLVLIEVINTRSFGWSMRTSIPWEVLGEAMLVATAAALLAGIYPAWRMARTSPAEALREE
ncbi:MAG: FtsX-like permease family protein [Dehalococcoidia bacterium]